MASGWTRFDSDKDLRASNADHSSSQSNTSTASNRPNVGSKDPKQRVDVSKPSTVDHKDCGQSLNPTALKDKRSTTVDVCVVPCAPTVLPVTDDAQCYSLPAVALGAREKQWPSSLVATALYDKSFNKCSSSCENLDIGKTQPCEHFAPHPRLCKASSDNPVYGAAAPPIPPRDYAPLVIDRPSPRPRAEIHPILQDGEQRSSTHYWLLPDKQRIPLSSQTSKVPELYMNVPHPVSPPNAAAVSREVSAVGGSSHRSGGRSGPADLRNEPSRSGSKKGVHDWCNSTVPLLADEADMDTASVDLPYGDFSHAKLVLESSESLDHHHQHKSSPMTGGHHHHHSDYEMEQPTTTSMIEARSMIEEVRAVVADVSADEASTALSTHHWNVSEAVKYIKVEHLFRLALASRQTCQSLLEKYGWNLEMAASALVDLPCAKSSSSSSVGGGGGGHGSSAAAKMTSLSHNREQSPKLQNVATTKDSKPSSSSVMSTMSTSRDLNAKQATGVHHDQRQKQSEMSSMRDDQHQQKQPLGSVEQNMTQSSVTSREHCPVSSRTVTAAATTTQRDHQTKQ